MKGTVLPPSSKENPFKSVDSSHLPTLLLNQLQQSGSATHRSSIEQKQTEEDLLVLLKKVTNSVKGLQLESRASGQHAVEAEPSLGKEISELRAKLCISDLRAFNAEKKLALFLKRFGKVNHDDQRYKSKTPRRTEAEKEAAAMRIKANLATKRHRMTTSHGIIGPQRGNRAVRVNPLPPVYPSCGPRGSLGSTARPGPALRF